MKRKVFSKLIATVMAVMIAAAYVPTFAFAADASVESVNVVIRSQAASAYMHDLTSVSVSSNEAENYGYTDSIAPDKGVSALDALVKSHELIFGDEFTAESAKDYLDLSSGGFVSKLFGETTYANGFMINQGYPNDGEKGTTVSTQAIADGDVIDFYIYQDDSYYSDLYTWIDAPEQVIAGKPFDVQGSGNYVMGAYDYLTPEAFKEAADNEVMEDVQLAWVDEESGLATTIEDVYLDEEGKATLQAPTEAGDYLLTAYLEGDEYTFVIMNPTKITVIDLAKADFNVTISLAGDFAKAADSSVMADRVVTASDNNMDGKFSIDEILLAAHKQYNENGAEAYESKDSQYGRSLSKLWGDESGDFGYWYANGNQWVSAWSLDDVVEEGGAVNAFVYADKSYYSDSFTYFNKRTTSFIEGNSAVVKLYKNGYDENWNIVATQTPGVDIYAVSADGKLEKIGKTNSKGNIVVKSDIDGVFNIIAKSDSEYLVPTVCQVTVVKEDPLTKAKKAACADLNASYDSADYRAAELISVLTEVIKGTTAINNAVSENGVATALASAKKTIAKIATDADYVYIEDSKVTGIAASNIATRSIKITWNSRSRYDGYQVYYMREGGTAHTVKVAGYKNTEKVIENLSKGKVYSVKVRGYKAISGKRVYGNYSVIKKVTITK